MSIRNIKIDRKALGWNISFVYIVYAYIGQIPQLKTNPVYSTISVSLFLIIVFAISSVVISGYKKSLILFLASAFIGSAMELLSLNTGIPFGSYHYTGALGPMLGPVPLFIPLLWASLSYYSLKAGGAYGMPFVMMFLDLSFDPRFSGNLWVWTSKTQYFGDPWTNFIGWFITSSLIVIVYSIVTRTKELPDSRGITFYLLFGINNCISDLYYHLFYPALISFVVFSVSSVVLYYLFSKSKNGKVSSVRSKKGIN